MTARPLPWSRILALAGGIGLGILLIVLLLRSVNLPLLGQSFARVDYRYMALAIIPFAINLLFKVPRWALLFGPDSPDWDTLFGALNVGYATNLFLPFRLGELVRAYWLRDRAGMSMVRTISTIAVERVSDGLAVVVMFVLIAPTVALPHKLLGPALTIGLAFVVALAVLLGLALNSTWSARLKQRLEATRFGFMVQAPESVLIGLHALRSKRTAGLLAIYTVIIWGSNAVLMWLVLRAFHLDVPFAAAVLGTAVVNMGMAVPSTPGFIGVFEALIVLVLGLYSVPHTPALAASLVFHAVAFVPVTIIGLIYIARTGFEVTLQMVKESAELAEEEIAADG